LFDCQGYGSEDEISDLKALANPTEVEENVFFSKTGIIEYIDTKLIDESPNSPI